MDTIRNACTQLGIVGKKKDCFIITRFNLHLYKVDKESNPVLTEDWLKDRFDLFETYCLPSIKKQTVQCFYWICLFASDTPDLYREKILQIHSDYDAFLPFFLNEEETKDYNIYAKEVIRLLKSNSKTLITFRIDNDDAIACDYVEKALILEKSQIEREHIYAHKYGIQYYAKVNLADKVPYPHNHFVFLINKFYEGDEFNYILQFNHGNIHLLDIPFTCISDQNIMWAEVIHGRNMDNDFMMHLHHKPIFSKNILVERFGWTKKISQVKTFVNIPFFLLPTALNHIVHRLKQKLGIIQKNH